MKRPLISRLVSFCIAEDHAFEFDELFVVVVVGKVRIRHRELVAGYVIHLKCTIQHVGVLGGPENIKPIRSTPTRQ